MQSIHIIDNQHYVCDGPIFDKTKVLHVGTKGSAALFLQNPKHAIFGTATLAAESPEVAELKAKLAISEAALAEKSLG